VARSHGATISGTAATILLPPVRYAEHWESAGFAGGTARTGLAQTGIMTRCRARMSMATNRAAASAQSNKNIRCITLR